MSLRALVIGFLGALFIAAGGFINDGVLYLESFTNGSQLPIIVIGALLLTLLVVNPLLMLCRRGLALRAGELALIVALWSASCSIPGRGLLEQFTHSMVMPYYWELQTPAWGKYDLLSYARPGQLVTLPPKGAPSHDEAFERVVNAYIRGRSDVSPRDASLWEQVDRAVARVPWSAWRAPLLTWMPLVLLSALASVCLAMITYRQWAHHEILSYPIAVFTDQLLVREEGRLLPSVMCNRMFWVGFLLLLVIRVNNGLVVWYPEYYIPVQLNFNMTPFAKVWPELFRVPYGWSLLTVRFFPLVIAFAFFLSAEISFTLGVSQLCWVLVALPMVTVGMNLSTDWVGGWQGWQRAGSYIMMFLILVYTGRNYYTDIVMRALGLRRRGQRDATDRANVWAFRVLAVAFVALVVLVCRLGLEWPFALITVFLMLLSFVVVARISAETGLFFIQPRWTIFGLLTAGLGSYVFSPTNQVICGLVCVMLCIDQCHALLPYVTNGMRLCERSQVSPSRVGVWTFAMYAVCVVAAVLVLLVAVYEWGVPQRMDWSYKRLPTMTFRTALPEINQLKAVGSLEAAETQPLLERLSHLAPRENFLGAFAFGLVAVGVFSFLRLRLPKWPLHPVMFLLWATYPMEQTCHAFLIGWLLKKCTLRFGGVQMVRTLQPLMIGVIGGELMAAIVFMIVGVVYYACTGEVPKVYRWFPR